VILLIIIVLSGIGFILTEDRNFVILAAGVVLISLIKDFLCLIE